MLVGFIGASAGVTLIALARTTCFRLMLFNVPALVVVYHFHTFFV